jgi:hypothetical protein
LPDEGQSGGTHPDLVFVPRGICFVRDWDERLAREGMTTLERSLPLSPHEHHLGFWLPARTPAPAGSAQWQVQLRRLRDVICQAQDGACATPAASRIASFAPRQMQRGSRLPQGVAPTVGENRHAV